MKKGWKITRVAEGDRVGSWAVIQEQAIVANFLRKAPNDKYDITVPNNYFNYKIKEHNVFYVDKDIYELGLTEVKTPMGNSVRVYDVERCICDIIRSKNRMDSEHIKHSIKEYIILKVIIYRKVFIYG